MLYATIDHIAATRPNIFGGGKGGQAKKYSYGWYASVVEVAESGVLGTVKQVENSNIYDWINALAIIRSNNEVIT